MTTQPRLPGTLPSPKAARAALARARAAVRQRRGDLVVLAEAHKGAREMLAGAIMEWEVAADDFERDASAGADARYLAAIENLRARRQAVAGAKLAVAEARKALRSAEREREAADEDLRAIAEGRRG